MSRLPAELAPLHGAERIFFVQIRRVPTAPPDKGEQQQPGGQSARSRNNEHHPWTHGSNPRFACLSRLLKDFGGHLESLKLLKLQHKVALRRLASAVQLRPWPPYLSVT